MLRPSTFESKGRPTIREPTKLLIGEKRDAPAEYFGQDDQTREDFEKDNRDEIHWVTEMGLNHLLARKKSSSSLRGEQLEAGSVAPNSTTASDKKQRSQKYPLQACKL